jgi:outer membrane protein assembly factor BamB
LTSSPSVAGGLVYFGSNDKHLYAVDMQGRGKWKIELGGAINSSPWPGDGVVFVGCDDGKIYAIE